MRQSDEIDARSAITTSELTIMPDFSSRLTPSGFRKTVTVAARFFVLCGALCGGGSQHVMAGEPPAGGSRTLEMRGSQTLESRLLPLIRAHKGKVSVAVKHLGTGESFQYHETDVMPTASLIKLPVMIEAYLRISGKAWGLPSRSTHASVE